MARIEHRTPRPRGQGQWALGYHEPLNGAEQIKKEAEPLEVRERIERVFAPGGFRSIGKQDLRNRMRWWGLYTQRKQGVPGERTGSAEPEELEDEFFMMRIRIDGGRLTAGPAARDRVGERDVRARRRRRDGPPERAAPLDPDRGRPRDLAPARSHRPHDGRGVRGHASGDPRLPARRDRRRGDPGRVARHRRDPPPVRRHDRVLEPAAQVQDVDQWLRRSLHRSGDQRHLARRRGASRARPRVRPVGRRRALDEPDVRPAPRRVRRARSCRRGVVRRDVAVPRVRVPALAQPVPAEVPGEGLGRRGVPSGPREGVPRGAAPRRARATPHPDGASRPRGDPAATRRPDLRRLLPPRGASERPSAAPRRRPRGSVRERRDPDDDAAEARDRGRRARREPRPRRGARPPRPPHDARDCSGRA